MFSSSTNFVCDADFLMEAIEEEDVQLGKLLLADTVTTQPRKNTRSAAAITANEMRICRGVQRWPHDLNFDDSGEEAVLLF